MIAKVSKAGVDRPFNIDAGFTSFKYVEISLIVLISDLVLSNFISKPNSILLISELISFNTVSYTHLTLPTKA